MYSSKIINESLSHIHPFVTFLDSRGNIKTIKFNLQETPIQKCQEFVDFFNDKIDLDLYEKTVDKGSGKTRIEFKKGWKPEIEHLIFIENERLMCKHSWDYWSRRYYKISNIENKFIQYSPTRAQRIWDNIDARLQEAGLPIKRQNAKARQQTSTTHSQGKVQHRIQFHSDVKGITASHDKDSTAIMAQMITDSMKRQPFWLRPKIENMVSDEYYYYDNNSLLNLGTGNAKVLSTGTTPTVGHLSEVSKFAYPEESILQSLLPAMHDNPVIFLVLESTAEGRDTAGKNNFWHKFWKDNVKGMHNGSYEAYPIFIPNCARDDTYPTEAWIRQRASIFAKWQPKIETIVYANKVRNYVITNPDLRDEFGSSWHLSREKMFWYETEYEKHKERGTLHIFLQEFPATPEDMFQHPGMGIYPIDVINYYDNKAQQGIPEVYKLRGDTSEVSYDLQPTPDEIDDSRPTITIRADWNSNSNYSEFDLVPVKFNGWDKLNAKNHILIFEHPKDDFEYGISVDTSDGLGERQSNDAAIEVIRKGTVEFNDKQVCEFTSPEIPQLQLWPFIMAISTYFSPREQSLLTIEINKGEDAQNAMMARGWWNLFLRKDSTVVAENQNSVRRFGFYTSPRSREALVSHLNSFIKGKWIDIHSVKLVEELKDLKKIRLITRIKEAGDCDNRFITLGIGLYALHRDEILGRETMLWEKRAKQNSDRVIIPSMPSFAKSASPDEVIYNTEDEIDYTLSLDSFVEQGDMDYWI